MGGLVDPNVAPEFAICPAPGICPRNEAITSGPARGICDSGGEKDVS